MTLTCPSSDNLVYTNDLKELLIDEKYLMRYLDLGEHPSSDHLLSEKVEVGYLRRRAFGLDAFV